MNDTELKPCPFCGERAETDFIPEHHSYQVECSDSMGCTARIIRDSELGAIEAWNCRAPAPASQPVAVPAGTVEHDSTPLPAGMEPVARIEGIDEYGPRLEWRQHWVDVGVGAKLFTAAQVQAMLTAAPSGPARKPLTNEALDLMCEQALFGRISMQQFARSIESVHGIR